MTHIETRNTHGFIQYKIDGRWQFNVTGFGDNAPDGSCVVSVQMYHGGTGEVMMDAQDRLIINGKKYTRKNWNH